MCKRYAHAVQFPYNFLYRKKKSFRTLSDMGFRIVFVTISPPWNLSHWCKATLHIEQLTNYYYNWAQKIKYAFVKSNRILRFQNFKKIHFTFPIRSFWSLLTLNAIFFINIDNHFIPTKSKEKMFTSFLFIINILCKIA